MPAFAYAIGIENLLALSPAPGSSIAGRRMVAA
jgi:hypothetical protein